LIETADLQGAGPNSDRRGVAKREESRAASTPYWKDETFWTRKAARIHYTPGHQPAVIYGNKRNV